MKTRLKLGGFSTDYLSKLLIIIKKEKPTHSWLREISPIRHPNTFYKYLRYFTKKKLIEKIPSKNTNYIHYHITKKGKQFLRLLP